MNEKKTSKVIIKTLSQHAGDIFMQELWLFLSKGLSIWLPESIQRVVLLDEIKMENGGN